MSSPQPAKRPERTWRQPLRTILLRRTTNGIQWVQLECEHWEPGRGLDLATAAPCQQCNPVRRDATPTPTAPAEGPRSPRPRPAPERTRPVPDFAYSDDRNEDT